MKRQNDSIFIAITGIILACGRLMLGHIKNSVQKDEAILIVMAIVNYIAIALVLLFINNDLSNYCREKIDKAGIETNQKKTRKMVINILSAIYLCIYLLAGILYIVYLRSNDLNDAISIIALALSIANNNLIKSFSPLYYKFIIKLSSFFSKAKKKLSKEQEKS